MKKQKKKNKRFEKALYSSKIIRKNGSVMTHFGNNHPIPVKHQQKKMVPLLLIVLVRPTK